MHLRFLKIMSVLALACAGSGAIAAQAPAWNWVWVPGAELQTRQNLHVYFRNEFAVAAQPKSARIEVSADSRYILYLNGVRLGRGPLKGDLAHYAYETYDLAPLLKKGTNVLAAHVHLNTGIQSEIHSGHGGFVCRGKVSAGSGSALDLGTPGAWKATASTGWQDNRAKRTGYIGYVADFDARKDPVGWMRAGFDDSRWLKTVKVASTPWKLMPRDLPQMRETLVRPAAVTDVGHIAAPRASDECRYASFDLFSRYHTDRAVAYAWTYLHAAEAGTVNVRMGSDDSAALWLNGKKLFSRAVSRGAAIGQERLKLDLNKGWNEVLIKVGQEVDKWELLVELPRTAGGKPLVVSADRSLQGGAQTWRVAGPFGQPSMKDFEKPLPPETDRRPDASYQGKSGQVTWSLVTIDENVSRRRVEQTEGAQFSADRSRVASASDLTKAKPIVIGPASSGARFTLDFGRELSGFVRLDLHGPAGAVIEMQYAEHPGANIGGPDTYVLREGKQQFETYHYQGFRYLTVTAKEVTKPLTINSTNTLFFSYPLESRGAFKCSDPLLNKIWNVGCHSLRCCLHETYEDCPGYEQLQYWGDARVETLVQMAAFGDARPFARGLRAMAWSRQPDGITYSRYPCWEPQIIPTFSLIWILSLQDYMLWEGDLELVREVWPVADDVLEWFNGHVGADGVLTDVPQWVFIDWSGDLGRFDKGASSILNAFYYGALVTAADLCGEQGNTSKAALYRSRAAALKTAYEKAFWSPALSAYVNSYRDGKQGTSLSQHAQALALLFDLAPVERRRPLVGQMLREDTMQATPYFMFYVLRALDHTGYYKYAPDQMRRWKSMLDRGATTWLEEWANKRSWCHAWSSAPTYELSTRVLGVRPDAPGFKKAVIEPFTAGLEWAKGTVPTPHGDISVDWWQKGPTLYVNYSAPSAVAVDVRVPAGTVVKRRPFEGKAIRTEKVEKKMPERVPVVLVTDCGTEMDDQWALSHLALSPRVDLLGVVTTHAVNLPEPRAESSAKAARGVLSQFSLKSPPPVVAGSSVPLADVRTPRAGAGADFIIKASRPFTGAKRLRLLVIGAATEAASALLKDPTLASRVEIVGMGFKNWPEGGNEFNIKNDIRAWQVILDSEAPVTVGDAAVCIKDLVVNAAKAEALLGGRGKPGRFLADLLINQVKASPEGVASVTGDRTAWPVWDEVTIAHVLGMTRSEVRPRPRLGDDFKFVIPEKPGGRTVRWITSVDSDALWGDLANLVSANAALKGFSPE